MLANGSAKGGGVPPPDPEFTVVFTYFGLVEVPTFVKYDREPSALPRTRSRSPSPSTSAIAGVLVVSPNTPAKVAMAPGLL